MGQLTKVSLFQMQGVIAFSTSAHACNYQFRLFTYVAKWNEIQEADKVVAS